MGDCVVMGTDSEVTMTPVERTCDIDTLVDYVRDFDQRIGKVFERVDQTVKDVQFEIDETLRGLVKEFIIGPLENIEDGARCGIMTVFYNEFVDGLCFQGA